jgi:hypothetical protein
MTELPDELSLPDELRALGRGLTVRAPEDLADRVLAGIAAAPARTRWWRRWLAGLVVLVAAVGVSAAVSAPVRAAIVHALRFGGVEMRPGPGPSPAASPVLPSQYPADLPGAARAVGFPVRVPAALGAPGSVTVADGRVVTLTYPAPAGTASPAGTVRLDEFAGNLGVLWDKYLAGGVAQEVSVNGHQALWFADQVTLVYVDANGTELPTSARSSSGTLVWTDGAVTYRLDGVRPLSAALAVARSLR